MNRNMWRLFPFLLLMLACQPMVVVGWKELLLVFLLVAVLTGPALYRLIRRIESRSGQNDRNQTNNTK